MDIPEFRRAWHQRWNDWGGATHRSGCGCRGPGNSLGNNVVGRRSNPHRPSGIIYHIAFRGISGLFHPNSHHDGAHIVWCATSMRHLTRIFPLRSRDDTCGSRFQAFALGQSDLSRKGRSSLTTAPPGNCACEFPRTRLKPAKAQSY